MSLSVLTSQISYVCASVLIVSAVLKFFIPWGLTRQSVGVIEGVIGVGVIVFSSQDNVFRLIFIGLMGSLYALYTGIVVRDIIKRNVAPCVCFGVLSHKPARKASLIRNIVLTTLSIVALFAEPKSLSFMGILASIVVLGAILFEEIR